MRLDQYLASNNYYPSREKAQIAIKKGYVMVNDKVILKPAFDIKDEKISITEDIMKYISMGGYKLEKAIDKFHLDFQNKVVLDIGCSTGGFTDCSLKHGAKMVVGVEIGTSQIHESLVNNPHVMVYENTNILDFNSSLDFDYLVADLSFVSLKKIIPSVLKFMHDNTYIVVLIKPQFEANIKSKDGVIRDIKMHNNVLKDLCGFFSGLNLKILGLTFSPNKGKKGNIEYLAYLGFMGKDNYNIDKITKEAFDYFKRNDD